MLQQHHKEPLLDRRRRIVEGEEVGERMGVVVRLGQDPILVERGDNTDRLGHQAIHLFDHLVALFQLALGKVDRVTLVASADDLIAILLQK